MQENQHYSLRIFQNFLKQNIFYFLKFFDVFYENPGF